MAAAALATQLLPDQLKEEDQKAADAAAAHQHEHADAVAEGQGAGLGLRLQQIAAREVGELDAPVVQQAVVQHLLQSEWNNTWRYEGNNGQWKYFKYKTCTYMQHRIYCIVIAVLYVVL